MFFDDDPFNLWNSAPLQRVSEGSTHAQYAIIATRPDDEHQAVLWDVLSMSNIGTDRNGLVRPVTEFFPDPNSPDYAMQQQKFAVLLEEMQSKPVLVRVAANAMGCGTAFNELRASPKKLQQMIDRFSCHVRGEEYQEPENLVADTVTNAGIAAVGSGLFAVAAKMVLNKQENTMCVTLPVNQQACNKVLGNDVLLWGGVGAGAGATLALIGTVMLAVYRQQQQASSRD